jgi:hypothetical protein
MKALVTGEPVVCLVKVDGPTADDYLVSGGR